MYLQWWKQLLHNAPCDEIFTWLQAIPQQKQPLIAGVDVATALVGSAGVSSAGANDSDDVEDDDEADEDELICAIVDPAAVNDVSYNFNSSFIELALINDEVPALPPYKIAYLIGNIAIFIISYILYNFFSYIKYNEIQ